MFNCPSLGPITSSQRAALFSVAYAIERLPSLLRLDPDAAKILEIPRNLVEIVIPPLRDEETGQIEGQNAPTLPNEANDNDEANNEEPKLSWDVSSKNLDIKKAKSLRRFKKGTKEDEKEEGKDEKDKEGNKTEKDGGAEEETLSYEYPADLLQEFYDRNKTTLVSVYFPALTVSFSATLSVFLWFILKFLSFLFLDISPSPALPL